MKLKVQMTKDGKVETDVANDLPPGTTTITVRMDVDSISGTSNLRVTTQSDAPPPKGKSCDK